MPLRNKHIAHNDLTHTLSIISYDEKHGLHFPQVVKKTFFEYEKIRKMWALIKCIQSNILQQIFLIIKGFPFEEKTAYALFIDQQQQEFFVNWEVLYDRQKIKGVEHFKNQIASTEHMLGGTKDISLNGDPSLRSE